MTFTYYVAGYPKSGTTWFTRLLGDVLDCRTGGSMASQDKKEIATEGLDRPRDSVVRKGHFILMDRLTYNPVHSAHRLNWKALRSEEHRTVFVVRDPRDIAVSGAAHWNISVESCLQNMIAGTNGFRSVGRWSAYVQDWLNKREQFCCSVAQYENMLLGPMQLAWLLGEMNVVVDMDRVKESYERQSFENRVADIEKCGHKYPLGKEFNQKFMRKGVAGDWRNHFDRRLAFEVETYFGDLLKYFKYEENADWWKEFG